MKNACLNEAADAGKLVIKLMTEQQDYDRLRSSQAPTRLPPAQRMHDQLEFAIQNYSVAAEIIETSLDPLNEKLVDPLWKLSQTYVDSGELDTALDTNIRAPHVYHVKSGFHNLEQVNMPREFSAVRFQLGDYSRADELQRL